MINEYLFLSDEYRASVEDFRPSDVIIEISKIENTQLWIATFSVGGKNEDSAKKLSEVHTTLMEYSPLVLSCESSEYYNRMLFPLVNELERKLRKLLYLAASISDNTEAKESIQRLEEKDFGEIFDLLFIDMNFISNLKKRINADARSEFNGKGKYSKQEIQSYLDSLDESLLWDVILRQDDVPTLRRRFRDVQLYRNDVMHAHNIESSIYKKAEYLFKKINKELDISIGRLIGRAEENLHSQGYEVNKAITSALNTMELTSFADALKTLKNLPAHSGVLEFLSQTPRNFPNLYLQDSSIISANAFKNTIFDTDAIKNAASSFRSSEMAELQKQAKVANEEMRIYLEEIRPYQAWLDAQKQITPPFSDNSSSLSHDEESNDAGQQGDTAVDKDK